MNSKQALENIKSRINSMSLFPKVDRKTYDESWEIIEKDLEVLEILKKHTTINYDEDSKNGLVPMTFNGIDFDDIYGEGYEEEFWEIIEWLER